MLMTVLNARHVCDWPELKVNSIIAMVLLSLHVCHCSVPEQLLRCKHTSSWAFCRFLPFTLQKSRQAECTLHRLQCKYRSFPPIPQIQSLFFLNTSCITYCLCPWNAICWQVYFILQGNKYDYSKFSLQLDKQYYLARVTFKPVVGFFLSINSAFSSPSE